MFDALKKLFLASLLTRWTPEPSDDEVIGAIKSCPGHYASSYSSSLAMSLNVTETFDTTTAPFINSGSAAIVHTGIDRTTTLNASSTPVITKMAAFQKAMTAGAATIDLTALTHDGATVTFNALAVRAFKFRNPSANPITITKGAVNGYDFAGATFTYVLKTNMEIQVYLHTGGTTVDATHKTIDISGTGTDSLDCELLAG